MWTKKEIKQFVDEYKFVPYNTHMEIRDLPTLLRPDETLVALLEGYFKKLHNIGIYGYGLIIVTNSRILFYRRNFFNFITMQEIPLNKLSAISFRQGLFFSSVLVTTSGKEIPVSLCNKRSAKKFVSTVQNLLNEINTEPEPEPYVDPTPNILEQLEKLNEMRERGDINNDEYRRLFDVIVPKKVDE